MPATLRAVHGSHNARQIYDAAYKRHAALLYGAICGVLSDGPHACAALQETFVTIWQNSGNGVQLAGMSKLHMLNTARRAAIARLNAKEEMRRRMPMLSL